MVLPEVGVTAPRMYCIPSKDMWVGFLTCEDGFAWGGGDSAKDVPSKDMWVGFLTCEDGFAWGGGDSTKDVLAWAVRLLPCNHFGNNLVTQLL